MDERETYNWDWFSPKWFNPGVWKSFDWGNEHFLGLILLIPVLFLINWLVLRKFRQKLTIAVPKKELRWQFSSLLRFIPNTLFAISLALLLMALSRPQKTNEKVEQWTEGIDIVLVMDISQSMLIEDFKPNRLESAKQVAQNFINGRYEDRIGIVLFSGEAFSLAPLTTDYNLLSTYIKEVDHGMIEKGGTAIGSALAVATNRMLESESKSKVLILLSDGDNNAGNIDPITAANMASAYDIKIYSIAVGREGRVPFGKDHFGRPKYVNNALDETTLRKIADIGGGKFYRVSNNKALQEVFNRIDTYEKAEIKETRFKNTTDYYGVYLKWGILFFLVWLFTKSTFVSNVLQD